MTPHRIVVVAGANGTLGKLVCEALLAQARRESTPLEVRGLVRSASAQAITDPNAPQCLKLIAVDFASPSDLARACDGAYTVVSTLQGLADVIIDVQSRLLEAAMKAKVRRFIPSDFSGACTKLPEGSHRNFDLRRQFHRVAQRLMKHAASPIEVTSIFQGGFTELLASGWVLLDYKKLRVNYFGSPDTPMEFTTWTNTAEFTAAAALDERPTPRYLYPAGQRTTPREIEAIAHRVTGADFKLHRVMSVPMLRFVIAVMKLLRPGKKGDVMPLWVAMQYGYCGALGVMSPARIDNDRYPGIAWQGIDEIVRNAFLETRGGSR